MLPNTEDEISPEQERLQKAQKKWIARIEREKSIHEDYRDTADEAWAIYLDDMSGHEVYYPLLWSVVNVQHAAVYSDKPIPDIRPRNSDKNPVFSDAADVMQRALEFYIDNTAFDDNVHRSVDDYLVAGLGVPRVKLDAEITSVPLDAPVTGIEGEEITEEEIITNQMIRIEHVPWNRFGWEICEAWEHVDWIYYRHRMAPKKVRARWGKDASFNTGDSGTGNDDDHDTGRRKKGQRSLVNVYEIWDRETKQVIHLAEGGNTPLEVIDDPLGLTDFFPSPPPAMTNMPSDDLEPVPDYNYIQWFDQELNRLYKRARNLTEQIKGASIHDASFFELENMAEIEDGDSIAVQNTSERMEGKPDLRGLIHFFPIQEKAQVLETVNKQIELKRRHVDDLLGISDIIRGSSNPQDGQETQKIKERWSGIRLRRKQRLVQKMVRNLFRLMSEVTVKHVTRENLSAMTQIQIDDATWQVLQNDVLREFTTDLETDSTIARDEFEDKKQRTELMTGIAQYVQAVAPAVAQNIIPADLGKELLKVVMSPYKDQSRELEDIIEKMPGTQQQLQQIQKLQGQVKQLTEQTQQKDYALAQFSQSEEQRQNQETGSKVALDNAKVQQIMADIPADQQAAFLDQMKVQIDQQKVDQDGQLIGPQIEEIEASTDLKGAQAIDVLRPDVSNG